LKKYRNSDSTPPFPELHRRYSAIYDKANMRYQVN
jgi:hypothetical protein